MVTASCIADWEWALSTDFGILVFVLIFLTWGLLIVNLFLGMLVLVHKVIKQHHKDRSKKK